jgi:hypothetical protein
MIASATRSPNRSDVIFTGPSRSDLARDILSRPGLPQSFRVRCYTLVGVT